MQIVLISDPLLNEYGPLRPVVLLSKELSRKHDVSVVSLKISEFMRRKLESQSVEPIDLGMNSFSHESFGMWFEACLPEMLFKIYARRLGNRLVLDECRVLKFSSMIAVPADIWYGQGFITSTLGAVAGEMPWKYKLASRVMKPLTSFMDKRLLVDMANSSRVVVANSKYCSDLCRQVGIVVHGVIHEPIDCEIYRPTTSDPSSDYVLTYGGKETKFSLIKKVADLGVKVKVFGAKVSYVPAYLRHHSNVEVLGRVADEELVDLYSNAFYTLFPFTDEPFGYIPVESMACGTPVLTYARQGPGETVVDGVTGWLAHNDDEIVKISTELERKGYPDTVRDACRKHSLNFDVKHIIKEWIRYMQRGK
jgi:glycosyltransferase involved in cell wall biosynthesis